MAEEGNAEAAEGGGEEQKGGMGRWIVILVILLVFIGAEVGLAVFFVNKLTPEDPALKALKAEQDLDRKKREQMTSMGTTLEEPISVTVNIAGTQGERFLKAGVQLEYDAEYVLLGGAIAERLPKIKNIVIEVLSTRPLPELLTIEGKKKVRDAIVADINMILPQEIDGQEVGKIKQCFFNEFVIQ